MTRRARCEEMLEHEDHQVATSAHQHDPSSAGQRIDGAAQHGDEQQCRGARGAGWAMSRWPPTDPATDRARAPGRRGNRRRPSRAATTIAPATPAGRRRRAPNHPAASHTALSSAVRGEEPRAPDHPRSPVRSGEDVVEALGPLEIDDEHDRREPDEQDRQAGADNRRSTPVWPSHQSSAESSIAPVEMALKSR